MASGRELAGYRIGVTADRRADEQGAMLQRLGAEVVHGPVIRTLPVGDAEHLRRVTEDLIADPPDFLIANTALGIRSWFGLASSWGLEEPLFEALRAARILARGPKAASAVTLAGLEVFWRASSEQLSSVADRLIQEDLTGARVALQLHGDDRQAAGGVLGGAGAEVIELPVYRWTLPADLGPARRLVEQICAGRIDAVTFTAGPSVRNLIEVAGTDRAAADLREAFAGGVLAACVGPVCAAVAAELGITGTVYPERWRLGPMVRLVADQLARQRRLLRTPTGVLTIQGSAVLVDGQAAHLTDRELGVLVELARRPGATVGRHTLLQRVWRRAGADPHVVDATVGRLRAKLGPAGPAVETVVRRGYRINAVEESANAAC